MQELQAQGIEVSASHRPLAPVNMAAGDPCTEHTLLLRVAQSCQADARISDLMCLQRTTTQVMLQLLTEPWGAGGHCQRQPASRAGQAL